MRFYLGTHHATQRWFDLGVPLFASRRVVTGRKTLPRASWSHPGWALDSGGFTELSMFGEWRTTEAEYVADVRRFQQQIGRLDWVAPMDWMCEPHMLAKTGLTVAEHQARTVTNFVRLREQLGQLVVPVLQGWDVDDYLRCWDLYHAAGVDLEWEDVVGLGTVCRRQNTAEAGLIVRRLADNLLGRQLHGFGVKLTGLESFGDELGSADSMAWSFDARRTWPLPGCTHKSCANCPRYAMRWRANLLERLGQQRLPRACARMTLYAAHPREAHTNEGGQMDDVTPRELMNDAARIGGWLRELRTAELERSLLAARIYEELGPLGKDDDGNLRWIAIDKRIRADRPELDERIRFLSVEVEAALARGRLVEMAAVAERYAL